ncbi:MAG: DinB family protein [Chloroflexi bacterium]|nr:DinB family protein [Chloroflexota bacterium]MBV9544946.1 DinB family protein [Chloroflexota bacterium]
MERPRVPLFADERTMLDAWLDFHRATLLMKCAGLSDEQLKVRSAEPSTLSLLGLVRHMTEVERSWFRRRIGGESSDTAGPRYYTPQREDDDFDALDSAPVQEVFDAYLREIDLCKQAAGRVGLDEVRHERSVRWIYTHMVEEYARHNGHADLLRERIDGSKGT